MAEFTVSAGESLDLYAALGATIGSDTIRVQNKSPSVCYLTDGATAPTNKNDGLGLSYLKTATNSTNDAGAFVSAFLSDARIFAEVV